MLEFYDYSSRRGILVPLLPKVHALLAENARMDKVAGQEPPAHIITWQQAERKKLVDINRRFLVAMEGTALAGIFFYLHKKTETGTEIYIEDLHIAWTHRNNPNVIEGLLKKMEFDPAVRDAVFYAGQRVKIEQDKEILASVGLKDERTDEWESLGSLQQTINTLKIRYNRA